MMAERLKVHRPLSVSAFFCFKEIITEMNYGEGISETAYVTPPRKFSDSYGGVHDSNLTSYRKG
jgi:hypothetical protein